MPSKDVLSRIMPGHRDTHRLQRGGLGSIRILQGPGGTTEIKQETIARSLDLVVNGLYMCACCRRERPEPGRDIDCRATARGGTTTPDCRGWHRAFRGPVAAVPR